MPMAEASSDDSISTQSAYRDLLETAPDAIVVVDRDGHIVLVNGQTENLFGYKRDELIGQPVEMLVPQRFRGKHTGHRGGFFQDPRLRPMGAGLELFGVRKDGTEFPVEISLSPLQTSGGVLVSSAIRDITDRKRLETALRDQNIELESASRAKDTFLAGMSHELRTPLNAIIGFTGTLLMRLPGPLTADQEQQLRTIQSSARHLLSLINDILDLVKIQSGKVELAPEAVVLQEVVEGVVDSLRSLAVAKGLRLEVSAPQTPLKTVTDRRAVQQILINVINNAIKYTDRGRVSVELTRSATDGQRPLSISVVDTGIGIRAEDARRVFEAFEQVDRSNTRRHEGAGLGLHLSQKLALLLDAELAVESEYGRGSRFTLRLPERP